MNPHVEKLLKLPVYQRIIILVVVVLLVIGGFTWFVYLPKQEEYRNLQDQNSSLQAKLQQDRRIAANLPKFKAEYEKMQQQLQQALAELPNQKEIPTLLTNISSLAKENGLEVLRFRPLAEVRKGFYAEVPVQLSLSGSYHEVALFFQAVGNLSRIVNIGNLTMGSPKIQEGRPAELSINCLATTFRFVEG